MPLRRRQLLQLAAAGAAGTGLWLLDQEQSPAVAAAQRDLRIGLISDLNSSYGSTTYIPQVSLGLQQLLALGPQVMVCAGDMVAGLLAMSVWASLVTRWPYNLALTLNNYAFGQFDSDGWSAYLNSLELAAWTAVIGTVVIFIGAYLLEKTRSFTFGRTVAQFMAMLPMAVPGLVLGLAYIFFFNEKGNPFGFIYATMAILVVNSITHFYTVSHLTATTALKQLDAEFEAVSASLKVSLFRTMSRVTVPVCLPAVLDISIYLFVNAMTTVSAVIFLYSTDSKLASVSIINMDESGFTAAAAAMAVTIVATSAAVKILHLLLTRRLDRRMQAWRQR